MSLHEVCHAHHTGMPVNAWFILSLVISVAAGLLGVLMKVLQDNDAAATSTGLILSLALAMCTGVGVQVLITKEFELLRNAVQNQTLDSLPDFKFGETHLLAQLLVRKQETTDIITRYKEAASPRHPTNEPFPSTPTSTASTTEVENTQHQQWHGGWCAVM